MIESITENSVYWILGTALIALALTIFGFITSLHLPIRERQLRVRKFALVGCGIVFFCLPIFKPYVSSFSGVRFLDKINTENLNSVEEIVKCEKDQTRNIERLKSDIVDLRGEVYRMNLYYSSVIQLLSTIIAMISFSFAFKKKEKELEEIQSDQIPKS